MGTWVHVLLRRSWKLAFVSGFWRLRPHTPTGALPLDPTRGLPPSRLPLLSPPRSKFLATPLHIATLCTTTRKIRTVVAVDGFSVPAGVDADHVPDLFRVVAADGQSVVVSYDGRVVWCRNVRTTGRCTPHTIDNSPQLFRTYIKRAIRLRKNMRF